MPPSLRGVYCEPFPITSITTPDDKPIAIPQPPCSQVIPRRSPTASTNCSKACSGRHRRGIVELEPTGRRKDGHDQRSQPVLVRRVHPQLSTAVWIGNVIPADEQTRRAYTLNGKCFGIYRCQGHVFGGTIAAPVWGKIAAQASEGMPVVDFTNPSPTVVNGEQVTIPESRA